MVPSIHGHGGGYSRYVPVDTNFFPENTGTEGHCTVPGYSQFFCTWKSLYRRYKKIFGAEGAENFFFAHSFPICTNGTLFFPHSIRKCTSGTLFLHIQLENVPAVQIFLHKIFGCTSSTDFFGHFWPILAIFWSFLGKNWENFSILYCWYTFFKKNFLICTIGTYQW